MALPHIPGDLLNGISKLGAVPDLGKHVGKFSPDRVILHNNIGETRLLIFFQRLQPLVCLFGDADGFRGHDQLCVCMCI
jgi:hypothetical protein